MDACGINQHGMVAVGRWVMGKEAGIPWAGGFMGKPGVRECLKLFDKHAKVSAAFRHSQHAMHVAAGRFHFRPIGWQQARRTKLRRRAHLRTIGCIATANGDCCAYMHKQGILHTACWTDERAHGFHQLTCWLSTFASSEPRCLD